MIKNGAVWSDMPGWFRSSLPSIASVATPQEACAVAGPPATLVVGPSWVGDMVMAQPLFKLLRLREPETSIDVLAPSWSRPLLSRMPEVRSSLPLDLKHGQLGLLTRFREGRKLVGRYRRAIVLPNSLKAALIPFHARIARRVGFVGEMRWGVLNDVRRLNKSALPRTVDRFLALGLERGDALPSPRPTPSLTAAPEQALARLTQWGIVHDGRPLLILCPGAEYGPAKRWPARHFAAVGRSLAKEGWQVLLLGSQKEADLCATVADQLGERCHNLAGRTTLEDAVDLLSLAKGVVCNDSGLMHVAAALGRPVVAVFGSSDPDHTPPVGPNAQVVSLKLPCAPCFKRHCPEQHRRCLEEISPDVVLKHLALLI